MEELTAIHNDVRRALDLIAAGRPNEARTIATGAFRAACALAAEAEDLEPVRAAANLAAEAVRLATTAAGGDRKR